MNFFTFDLKKVIIVVALIALPLISVNLKNDPEHPAWYNRPFTFFASMTESLYSQYSQSIISSTLLYIDLIDIKRFDHALLDENRQLRSRQNLYKELQIENARLSQMLDFKQKSEMKMIAAKVISHDAVSDHSTVHINRGTSHGLIPGMAVITTEGIVGYIFRPEYLTSQVLLITDRYAVIDAIVQRTRARGIIEGKNRDLSQMRFLERAEDVAVGDTIITSGADDFFPKGFPVGIVTDVLKKNYEASLRVSVKPIVDSGKIEEVFIILDRNPSPQQTAVNQ